MSDAVTLDLRSFFRSVGHARAQRALMTPPAERPDASEEVEEVEDGPAELTGSPLPLAGFVDGIQASVCVTHRDRRPVYLFYVAAACVGAGGRPVDVEERMRVVASWQDTEWADELEGNVPVDTVGGTAPPEIEAAAHRALGGARSKCEADLIARVVDLPGTDRVVIDGSLSGRVQSGRLVGVVKTARTKYLPDEQVLWKLKGGWRSQIFRIGGFGDSGDRYSCYVRIHDRADERWDFGLIRLEAYDPDLLGPLAVRTMLERQPAGVRDARWDRHLAGVRACEDFLRGRRPHIFS